jgi:hypothetical protein
VTCEIRSDILNFTFVTEVPASGRLTRDIFNVRDKLKAFASELSRRLDQPIAFG